MSRYRNIHCLIWNDDKFPFASDDCKLVFFHLLTTPYSSPFGMYKISVSGLADEMRWPVKRYEKAFREALSKGFLKYDERHYVILLPKFLKHNPPNNPNVLKSWAPMVAELPDSTLKVEWFSLLKGLLEGFGEGFRKAFAEAWPKGMPIQDQDQEQEQNTGTGDTPPDPPEGFCLPSDIDPEIWEAFVEMRKKIKAPLTQKAIELTLAKLETIRSETGQYKNDVLKEAIQHSWRGVFPLKTNTGGANGRRTEQTYSDGQEYPCDLVVTE